MGRPPTLTFERLFPFPAYLVRDNDRAYGHVLTSRLRAMDMRDRPISPGSPWQNGYAAPYQPYRRRRAPRCRRTRGGGNVKKTSGSNCDRGCGRMLLNLNKKREQKFSPKNRFKKEYDFYSNGGFFEATRSKIVGIADCCPHFPPNRPRSGKRPFQRCARRGSAPRVAPPDRALPARRALAAIGEGD